MAGHLDEGNEEDVNAYAMTFCPTYKPTTPSPVWTTSPARSLPKIAGYFAPKISESCIIQSIGLIATYWTLIATCPGGGERYGADETTKGRVLAFSAHAAVLEGDVFVAMVYVVAKEILE
jgi:hypothetical protein